MNCPYKASLTWIQFKTNSLSNIDIFEDPVYSTYIGREIFIDMYGKVLETLDGSDMSSYIDFYFELSPINNTIYLFKDEDAKLDFRDFAIELGLIPEIKEIMEGESKTDKEKRNFNRPSIVTNTEIPPTKLSINKGKTQRSTIIRNKSKQAQITIDKLMTRLKTETDPAVRSNIERKIENTLKHIDTSV